MKMQKQIDAVRLIIENQANPDFLIRLALVSPDAVLNAVESALDRDIKDLYGQGKRVQAIKLCRQTLDIGLKDAKNYCENLTDYKKDF